VYLTMIRMSRFLNRRKKLEPPPSAESEPPDPDTADLEAASSPEVEAIEREIMAEEAKRLAEQRRIGRKWVPLMTPLWAGGCLCTLFMLAAASKSANGALAMGVVSMAVNGTASYAIRKGGAIAPRRFPVTYSSKTGRVNGANFSLLLAFLGLGTAFLGFNTLFL